MEKSDYELPAQLLTLHQSILKTIESTNGSIGSLIARNETEFLIAFYQKMKIVGEQFEVLKRKMQEEVLRRKADQKFNILEEERDYFRAEAVRLDQELKAQKSMLHRMKLSQEDKEQDYGRQKVLLLQNKMQNDVLRAELSFLIQNLQSGMMQPDTLIQKVKEVLKYCKCVSPKKTVLKSVLTEKQTQTQIFVPKNRQQKIPAADSQIQKYKDKLREVRRLAAEYCRQRTQLELIFKDCVTIVKEEAEKRQNFTRLLREDKRKIFQLFFSTEFGSKALHTLVFGQKMLQTANKQLTTCGLLSRKSRPQAGSKQDLQITRAVPKKLPRNCSMRVLSAQTRKVVVPSVDLLQIVVRNK